MLSTKSADPVAPSYTSAMNPVLAVDRQIHLRAAYLQDRLLEMDHMSPEGEMK